MTGPEKQPTVKPSSKPPVEGAVKGLYIFAATVFLGLGLAGVILPGLPTTPFLLLMSYFLMRSSPTLHARLVAIPIVGAPIRDWQEKHGVRTRVKWIASFMVGTVVGCSLAFGGLTFPLRVVVLVLAVIGLTVIVSLPTISKDAVSESAPPSGN